MFGNKLRSWMDAVRPKKRQARKEKQKIVNAKTVPVSHSTDTDVGNIDSKSMQTISSQGIRYSGANLSSPESAYSTGYSTDGTSPGAPPEYYINIRTGTRYFPPEGETCRTNEAVKVPPPLTPRAKPKERDDRESDIKERNVKERDVKERDVKERDVKERDVKEREAKERDGRDLVTVHPAPLQEPKRANLPVRLSESIAITSPRQRNRIRTNPWVPSANLSPTKTPLLYSQDSKSSVINSPLPTRYLSPKICSERKARCDSLSSSSASCSSLSAASLNWDASLIRGRRSGSSILRANRSPRLQSASDEEEDCTLNEVMGKYDESYVYEKETDILSDSDPTDCDTDIDTGQDGGDEDDPLEAEFDFIDNGSFLEFNVRDEQSNTGHCTYYNFEVQRRCSRKKSSHKTQKEPNLRPVVERRQRTSSKTKRKRPEKMRMAHSQDGTRSAGATPISVRRTKIPVSKLALEDRLRKRSNSVSIPRDTHFFDQRDKEADQKYKELIVEADHILKNMKTNCLSPRRVPGPANKRVELLRTESTKTDVFMKNRLEDPVQVSRIPSNFSPRFSPKRNHITKFISNNSPVLIRRDVEKVVTRLEVKPASPLPLPRKADLRRSPKYRKKCIKKTDGNTSSDSENERKTKQKVIGKTPNSFSCPQSEPVKRKVYNEAKARPVRNHELSYKHLEINHAQIGDESRSCEALRQQVLLNTIASLKRSLEDQSASLKQAYKSSQNIHL